MALVSIKRGSAAHKLTPSARRWGACKTPKTSSTTFLSEYFSRSTVGRRVTNMSVPPGASTSQLTACVSWSEIASKMTSMGAPFADLVISVRTSASFRSTTAVAPRDSRRGALCKDEVAIIDEKPESLANWMAKEFKQS